MEGKHYKTLYLKRESFDRKSDETCRFDLFYLFAKKVFEWKYLCSKTNGDKIHQPLLIVWFFYKYILQHNLFKLSKLLLFLH